MYNAKLLIYNYEKFAHIAAYNINIRVVCKHMSISYNYIPSSEFIDTLEFDYIETYSFQRGAAFENNRKKLLAEYDVLKRRREKSRPLTQAEVQHYNELDGLLGVTQYLINGKGQLHPSSQKVRTFDGKAPEVKRLKEILETEVVDIPLWLCAPVYRDGIIFYDKVGKIVSTLNVCLSCRYMELQRFVHLNADNQTYDQLKQFFLEVGHRVEQD
jgi:hypothetical protein